LKLSRILDLLIDRRFGNVLTRIERRKPGPTQARGRPNDYPVFETVRPAPARLAIADSESAEPVIFLNGIAAE
jgi:hypothetical protein